VTSRNKVADAVSGDDHEIGFALGRMEWLRTEWPAVFFRGAWPVPLLCSMGLAPVGVSPRGAWRLRRWWWPLGGRTAAGIAGFLLRGTRRIALRVRHDGAIFASADGSEPVYCHWVAFEDSGQSYVLRGGDGRYRLIIPKRALRAPDHTALRQRAGVDLSTLAPGQEVRLGRHA